MLFGALELFMLRVDMILAISSLSVGWVNIEFLHWLLRKSEKCLWEYLMLSLAVSATEEK